MFITRTLQKLHWLSVWLFAMLAVSSTAEADVFRWDNGQLIRGTEGITPEPGVQLDHRELAYAALSNLDLTGSRFDYSNLSYAILFSSTLTNANLSGANLANASLSSSKLTNANLAGAIVAGAVFAGTTSRGFTKEQLYSTASYQQRNLRGIVFASFYWAGSSDLTGWDLSGQDLTGASFSDDNVGGTLRNANLAMANLTNAYLVGAILNGANLAGAIVTGADFNLSGLTKEQLYSTASYQQRNLKGLRVSNDLTGWDLSGQDLSNANLSGSILTNVDLSGAIVARAAFSNTTSNGFTKEQLYSTASYQQRNLQGIGLHGNDLTGWDLSGQNLTGAYLHYTTLTGANFTGSNLTNGNFESSTLTDANFAGAIVTGARFWNTTSRGFTKEQIYSTSSYQQRNLQGIGLDGNDLTGWDLSDQDLTNANLAESTLTDVNFVGAIVNGTSLLKASYVGFNKEQLYSTASYQQKNLRGIGFGGISWFEDVPNDLSGWDLSGQDLVNAGFGDSMLTGADLTAADLRGARYAPGLTGAIVRNAIRFDGSILGLGLNSGDELVVHDDDGLANSLPTWDSDGFVPRPAIPIRVYECFAVSDGGAMRLVFEADAWDSLISFEPGIPIQLGGTLELTFAADVDMASQVGRTLRIFDWTGVTPTGEFAVDSPYLWDLSRLYSSGEVTLLAIPESSTAVLLLFGTSAAVASNRIAWRICGARLCHVLAISAAT